MIGSGADSGNFHPIPGAPVIDFGNDLVDFDPWTAGFQPAPALDLGGGERRTDGNADGDPVIDMGAYELQGG